MTRPPLLLGALLMLGACPSTHGQVTDPPPVAPEVSHDDPLETPEAPVRGPAATPNAAGADALDRGDAAAAVAAFGAAKALAPEDDAVGVNLAIALTVAGRSAQAIDELNAVLARTPRHPRALLAKVNALVAAGNRSAAWAEVEQLLGWYPGMTDGHFARGRVALTLGRREDANQSFYAVLDKRPDDLDAMKGLLTAASWSPDSVELADLSERLLERAPNDPDVLCNIGAAHQVKGDLAKAEALYRQAVAADAKHPCANYNLASLLHKRQGLAAARPHYEAYLERAPSHEARQIDAVKKLLETSP